MKPGLNARKSLSFQAVHDEGHPPAKLPEPGCYRANGHGAYVLIHAAEDGTAQAFLNS